MDTNLNKYSRPLYPRAIAIEVTRRCNLNCRHCMRGKQQNVECNTEYIDKFLGLFSKVGEICFTGGEPLLNIPLIEYTLKKAKELNIRAEAVQIVTNGLLLTKDIAERIANLAKDLTERELDSLFHISIDEFHKELPKEVADLVDNFKYIDYKISDKPDKILKLGNAVTNAIGTFTPATKGLLYQVNPRIYDYMIANILTMSCSGDIILSIDYEYDRLKEVAIANINDNKEAIIKNLIDRVVLHDIASNLDHFNECIVNQGFYIEYVKTMLVQCINRFIWTQIVSSEELLSNLRTYINYNNNEISNIIKKYILTEDCRLNTNIIKLQTS